jgi:hypothetical protein
MLGAMLSADESPGNLRGWFHHRKDACLSDKRDTGMIAA